MESLDGIVVFTRSAESLSFVAAGRLLGVSSSAVGKSITRLERTLGVRLFHRSTRRISLTHEGQMFYERCSRILEDLRDAEAMLSASTKAPRGKLRVSLPIIGYRFLWPHLQEFCALYPDIELDLDFNDRLVDVIEEGVDVVIRSGELRDSTLVSRRLGTFNFVVCASPAYLKQHGAPVTPADLEQHRCLRFRFPTTGKLQEWALGPAQQAAELRLPATLVSNNMEALQIAALAGMGVAYMPDFLAREALEKGQLRTLLSPYLITPGQFWALWPSKRQLSPKLRVLVDFLSDRLFR